MTDSRYIKTAMAHSIYLCYSYLWKQRKGQHEDTFLHQGGSVYLLELGIHATLENKQHTYAE